MENKQQALEVFESFIKCINTYTKYYSDKVLDNIEDLKACNVVLREIQSGFPSYFVNEYLFGKISTKLLNRAEEFDKNLFRVKLIPARLDIEEKKEAEDTFAKIESLLAFCVRWKAKQEGRWED